MWKSACGNNFVKWRSRCKFSSQRRSEVHPGISHTYSHLTWFLTSWVGAGSIFGQLPCLPYVVGMSWRNQQPGPAGLVLSHAALTQVERKEQRKKNQGIGDKICLKAHSIITAVLLLLNSEMSVKMFIFLARQTWKWRGPEMAGGSHTCSVFVCLVP